MGEKIRSAPMQCSAVVKKVKKTIECIRNEMKKRNSENITRYYIKKWSSEAEPPSQKWILEK